MPATLNGHIKLDVNPGAPVRHHNLTMFPLLGWDDVPAPYLTLDEALGARVVEVGELSEQGSVPELRVKNVGAQSVLLLDGEELIGAKQNRVLNLSIMVPADAEVVIPVSCVEAGRWRRSSRHFSSSGRIQFSRGRARKMAQVSESLERRGARTSDQLEVWSDIDDKMSRMRVESGTRAMSDAFDRHKDVVEAYVDALQPQPGQGGALFAIDGRAVGVELFDCGSTLRKTLAKIVRAYALDAIEDVRHGGDEDVWWLLDDLAAAAVRRFPAVGMGSDVRFSTERTHGAALEVEGRLVHLAAFAHEG